MSKRFLRFSVQQTIVITITFLVASAAAQERWVGSWACSQQLVEPHNSLAHEDTRDMTLRQIVRLTMGGQRLRLHLSNRFGKTPLHLTSVQIALPVSTASSRIQPGSEKELTFSGRPDVTIPAGADYVSDPIAFKVAPLSGLAITLHTDDAPPDEQTGHPGSRTTSYFVHGELTDAPELKDAKTADHWYFVSGIDVAASPQAAAVVVIGDSITDGRGSTTNGNDRWPDVLARRLQSNATTKSVSVLNHGIGGNRILHDNLGPSALSRFDHDVIVQAGAKYLIILEGVNDLGTAIRAGAMSQSDHEAFVRAMTTAYDQMITRAHTHGIKVIGCPILPFVDSGAYHPSPAFEADRQAINKWIRTSGKFDAVIDLDKVMRDPARPEMLLPAYDTGDHLHPNPAGYEAMGGAFPLALFGGRETAPKSAVKHGGHPAQTKR